MINEVAKLFQRKMQSDEIEDANILDHFNRNEKSMCTNVISTSSEAMGWILIATLLITNRIK